MRRLAMTIDGRMTYCTASPDQRGEGRCNHVAHQKENETTTEFCARIASEIEKSASEQEKKDVLNLDISDKQKMIERGENLDIFINDKDWIVRAEVARQGYGLDKLINDKDGAVRAEVARQGYGLDKLVDDEDWVVRVEVARQGYRLDKLVNDKDSDVRAAVAMREYKLDKLINDKHWFVRKAVASQGYGLNILIKATGEGSSYIKKACKEWMLTNGCKNIEAYEQKFPDFVVEE